MKALRLATYVLVGIALAAAGPLASRCEKPLESGLASSLLQTKSGKSVDPSVGQTSSHQVSVFHANRQWHEGQQGLHRIVGKDGVLMISSSGNATRFKNSSAKLAQAGIHTTLFPMTDGHDPAVTDDYLNLALSNSCGLNCTCHVPGSPHGRAIQALADSHRRALIFASHRESAWTAILEDDAVPVRSLSTNFSAELEQLWTMLPDDAGIVRLSYCFTKKDAEDGNWTAPSFAKVSTLRFTTWQAWRALYYQPGMCTTAYMVHKDFIPEMLSWFPVSCVIDGAYAWRFSMHQPRMYSIEQTRMSEQDWHEDGWWLQLGIMRQDWKSYKTGTTAGDRAGE